MGVRVRLVGVAVAAAALAFPWGAAQAAGAEATGPAGHLTLVGHGDRYVAQIPDPHAGAKVSFALVGEGMLTGPAVCVTPASGQCEVTVGAVGTDGATLAAQAGGETATVAIAGRP